MAKTKRIIGFIVAVVALVGAFALSACSKKEADDSTTEYSFNIGKTAISLEVGESEKLECRYGDKTIVFVSSDPSVATVAEDGTITALRHGRRRGRRRREQDLQSHGNEKRLRGFARP